MVKMVMTGNYATAWGAKISRAEVISAYPITPQTTIVEKIAEFVGNAELDAQYVKVESEHSALASCISASQTGVRAFTATSCQGLLLMHEMIHWAAHARTPVGLVNVNRAIGPPWSIWADHADSISQRDTGAVMLFVESSQEILDSIIQLFKVVENKDVLLPYIVSADAFFLSHTFEPVDIPDQDKVDDFLPKLRMPLPLDPDDPHGYGSLSMPHQWYMELQYNINRGMEKSYELIPKVIDEWKKIFGRDYHGHLEEYRTEDAEVAIVAMGTMVSTAREVVDKLRSEGQKVGLVKIRTFRPFPVPEIREIGKRIPCLGVLDRGFTFGYGGPLHGEMKAALYDLDETPVIKNYIVGIGGRDITIDTIEKILKDVQKVKEKGLDKEIVWVDLKHPEGTPPEVV
jgi:2-oxoisovalerate ferredoxin oxidoreductase alpha subunit